MRTFLRYFTLLAIVLLCAGAVLSITSTGMTMMNWMYPLVALAALFLLGLWFLGFGPGIFKTRVKQFFIALGCFLLLGILGVLLLRYEGSTSGSSFPKFRFVWQKPDTAEPIAEPLVQSGLSTNERRILGAAADLKTIFGPARNGIWEAPSFATDWSTTQPKLLWRRAVGKGWSSFVVAGNRAITQEQAGDEERVLCLNIATGKEIWHYDDLETRLLLIKEENAGARMGGDGPRATPSIHEAKVYAVGATGIANCLSLETGKKIWSRHMIDEFGGETQRWGIANAPLVLPELKAVLFAGTDFVSGKSGVTYAALDLESGETKWTYRGEGASYASPRILTIHGVRQIVSVNRQSVSGIAPASGKEIWRHEWKGQFPKVGQPHLIGENRILVTASYGVGTRLIEIAKDGEGWSTDEVWNSNRMKTKFSSAAIHKGWAWGLDEGRLAAISLEDGTKTYKKEKFGFGQNLLFGDHMLIQSEKGPVVIGKIGPEGFTETGRIEDALSSMTWNVPAVAGRILLVRNDREAACYLLPKKKKQE